MKYGHRPLNRKSNIVIQELKDEILIYDLDSNKAFCLNETSALIWKLCNGENTISEISQKMTKELKEPVSKEYIWLALNELAQVGLMYEGKEYAFGSGVNRREMIRSVGKTAIIALPFVSSIVAPKAINAQSVSCAGISSPGCNGTNAMGFTSSDVDSNVSQGQCVAQCNTFYNAQAAMCQSCCGRGNTIYNGPQRRCTCNFECL